MKAISWPWDKPFVMTSDPAHCDTQLIREIQSWIDQPNRALPSQTLDEKACWDLLDRSTAHVESSDADHSTRAFSGRDTTSTTTATPSNPETNTSRPSVRSPIPATRRYEPERFLGAGGFGVVIQAKDTLLGRDVAIKMIRPSRANQPSLQHRFIREARAVASLVHPGIVQVYETGTIDGQPFLAGELVDGPNLAQFLEQTNNSLSPTQSAWLVQQIAVAVQYAHSRGILHRDLKPSNILLAPADKETTQGIGFVPKLTDFGLAKRFGAQGDFTVDVSTESVAVGTIRYMSPEQVREKHQDVTNRSDIFSLGIILYQLTTGRMPFDGDSFFEISEKICRHSPERPRTWKPTTPRDLDAVILKCLNKAPDDRYQTAAELANDLDRWMKGVPVEATKPSLAKTIRYWARTSPRTLAVTSIVLATIIVAFIAINTSWLRERMAHERAEKSLKLTLDAIDNILFPMTEKFNEGLTITRQDHETILMNTIAFNEAYLRVNPDDLQALHRLSIAHHYCAHDYSHMNRMDDANKHRKASLEILKNLTRVDKDRAHQSKYLYQIFFGYLQLSDYYYDADIEKRNQVRYEYLIQAKHFLDRSLELDPDNLDYQEARLELNFQLSFVDRHKSEESTARLNENIVESVALWKKQPTQPRYLKHALMAKRVLAILAFHRSEFDLADKLFDEACEIEELAYPPDAPGTWILHYRFINSYHRALVSYCAGNMDDFGRYAQDVRNYYDQCIALPLDKEFFAPYRLGVLYLMQKAYEHIGNQTEFNDLTAQIDSIEPMIGPGPELDTAAWIHKMLVTQKPSEATPF